MWRGRRAVSHKRYTPKGFTRKQAGAQRQSLVAGSYFKPQHKVCVPQNALFNHALLIGNSLGLRLGRNLDLRFSHSLGLRLAPRVTFPLGNIPFNEVRDGKIHLCLQPQGARMVGNILL